MEVATELALSPALIASAAAGDRVAFGRIVAEHHDDLVRIAYLVGGDADLAHDATQAAWAIAWRKLASLREPEHLRAWLSTIAANEARQPLRRRDRTRVREIDIALVAGGPIASTTGAGRDETIDLMRALDRLAGDDRQILAMRYVLGLTSDEIGRSIGMSAPGVRSRLSRAIARLRKDLGDD
ncbi:MAG TPA: RNA polymerase sigma factor [Candidatus Limnocylindrales bacterium]|jgi:RNA polymerase sigma-70 factor (ECF subfamily)